MRRLGPLLLLLLIISACGLQLPRGSEPPPGDQPPPIDNETPLPEDPPPDQPDPPPPDPEDPPPPPYPEDPPPPPDPEDPPPDGGDPPATWRQMQLLSDPEFSYTTDLAAFPNPERGFHTDYSLVSGAPLRAPADVSLVRSYVRLDDWRYSDLPQSLLNDLQRGFDVVRNSGLKVVPRFTYNFGPDPDAPLSSVLRHIEQLMPVLNRNADVIAVLQAGFIGRWGEWHHSTNGLDRAENKRLIGEALLAALPEDRMVQIRTPYHIRHVLDSAELFDARQAFSGSDAARIGFVNDCFLAGHDDAGTFDRPLDYEMALALTPFTVTGGETCAHQSGNNREECPNALAELADYHWDYLNAEYYHGVLDRWHAGGCFAEIARRLGYRFSLLSSALELGPDGLQLELEVHNGGFGKLYNPRPFELMFVDQRGQNEPVAVLLAADARTVLPLASETRQLSFTVRPELPPGRWELQLRLPDAAPALQQRPEYSIRLASLDPAGEPLWVAATGSNRLGFVLQVPAD